MSEVYLVAPGPSLDITDRSLLRGKDCIAINSAFLKVPFAKIIYFTDKDWLLKHDLELRRQKAGWQPARLIRGTMEHDKLNDPNVEEWTFEKEPRGLSRKPMHLCHGHNSGAAAINLAVQLGYCRIYLLGYDMHNRNGRQHFAGDEAVRKTPDSAYAEVFAPSFRALVKPLKDLGVEVVNLTPGSALTVFPVSRLEDVLQADSVMLTV